MSEKKQSNNLHVILRNNVWAVYDESVSRDIDYALTQEDARQIARRIAIQRKVEVIIHGVNGEIVARDSYGNDPYPPPG